MNPAWPPLIVSVAPNGARKSRADHPALPITPPELAETARRCEAAGAALLHLHVRDAAGAHSLAPEHYRPAIAAIRAALGDRLVLQVTSEAVGRYRPEQQMAMVETLRPEAVSLALRELLPQEAPDRPAAARFLAGCWDRGLLVQFILYDPAELALLATLQEAGTIPPGRLSVLFVLGRYSADQQSDPKDLLPFLAAGGTRHLWSVCAFGTREAACAAAAVALGGHARVGFENNLRLPDGSLAPDNAALVQGVAELARQLGRPLADATAARALMRPA